MLVLMCEWIIGPLLSSAWNYLAGNWSTIALYLIGAAVVCAAVRKFLALYGRLPLVVGVVILVLGAWTAGYSTAPVKTVERTVVKPVVQTVEKTIVDHSMIDRLRGRIAALEAELRAGKEAASAQADAARRAAEAALAALEQARGELAAANAEIGRLKDELAVVRVVRIRRIDGTGQCPQCGHLMQVSEKLRNEQIRCRQCGLIMSVKTAWAHRAYVLDRQR